MKLVGSLAFLPVLLISGASFAALGDHISVDASATSSTKATISPQGKTRVETQASFSVRTTQDGPNTLREYFNSSGLVFAVVWSGMAPPALPTTLGTYQAEYETAYMKSPRNLGYRAGRTIASEHIVVEHWGHMGRLEGRAYNPTFIPTGVSLEEIK